MVATELTFALTSLNAAVQIARGISDLKTDVAVKQSATELLDNLITVQSGVLSLQVEHQKLLEANNDLRKQIVKFKEWEKTESQYSLFKTVLGNIVMAPNANHPSSNPLHWLCTNCFEDKKKSILQTMGFPKRHVLVCPICKSTVILEGTEFGTILGQSTT